MAISENINPIDNLYSEFKTILSNIIIKYNVKAEAYETLESKQHADEYIDAYYKRDTFLHYRDYTVADYYSVGLTNDAIIEKAMATDIRIIPVRYQNDLLELRRARVLSKFEEQNDYYRLLEGYPPLDTSASKYYYPNDLMCEKYGLDKSIPIHKIQDYYNLQSSGLGDRYISIIEGTGYLDKLIAAHPDEEYLTHIGTKRISIITARAAKNFSILSLPQGSLRNATYDKFVQVYEQCRDYFVSVIFNVQYRSIMDYYDNFIALCIMVMTMQQVVMKQIPATVERDFFDIYGIRLFYESYGVPFNLNLDDDTQKNILRNLNLLIQNKSTNKVIYDIAELLGYKNMNVYKYYLAKERNFDIYGVPIVAYTERFNSDTGEMETIKDYDKMYDVYFQRCELSEQDFVKTFNDPVNNVDYAEVTEADAFWWEDENVRKMVWETEYNFVESKYLSLGVSYKMSDIMVENILLLKLLMAESGPLSNVMITLPKILPGVDIPVFDAIILLVCLTAKNHNLYGEIISVPTQITAVLDYMQNIDDGGAYPVDTFAFNFDYFDPNNERGVVEINELADILGDDKDQFLSYISVLSINSDATDDEKIIALNSMYANIKNLANFISYKMTETTDRRVYETLKRFYQVAFYSKEIKSTFALDGETTGAKRVAWSYFEFLYHLNYKLYDAIFHFDMSEQYATYINEQGLSEKSLSYDDFVAHVESGEIKLFYDTLDTEVLKEDDTETSLIYYYVSHIIARLELIMDDLNFIYMLNDSATPIEDLLLKMIRFFKSFTVDVISMDTIFTCDMTTENMLRFFDEIDHVNKTIEPREQMQISYADVINGVSVWIPLSSELKFVDDLEYEATLYIDNDYPESTNAIYMEEEIELINKEIEPREQIAFTDVVHTFEGNVYPDESIGFADKVMKMWYSD